MTDKKIVVIGACGLGRALAGLASMSNNVVIDEAAHIADPLAQPNFNTFNNRRDVRDPRRNFKSVNKPQMRVKRGRR